MSILDKIRKDPRVSSVDNEGEDGFWVYLKDGFRDGLSDCHAVHEWSLKDLRAAFKFVEQCDCADCLAAIRKAGGETQPDKPTAQTTGLILENRLNGNRTFNSWEIIHIQKEHDALKAVAEAATNLSASLQIDNRHNETRLMKTSEDYRRELDSHLVTLAAIRKAGGK